MDSPLVQFIVMMIVVTVGWAGFILLHKRVNPITYFMSQTGLGILKGVVLAIAFASAMAFVGSANADDRRGWFLDAEVYAGIENTQRVSPQCVSGGLDDTATSNLGLRVNVYQNGPFRVNSKYTHHSCAFGEDDDGYDAVGIELIYKFWER